MVVSDFRSLRGDIVLGPFLARRSPAPKIPFQTRRGKASLTLASRDATYPVPSIQVTAQGQDMNAPPNVDPATAHSDSDVVRWLTNGTRDERFIEALRNLIQADHG